MHRKERQIEADEDQPERPASERLAHHSAGDLGKPVIDRAEQRKYRAADQHVMEMRDDEIGVVHLRVERHGGDHHAGQAADDEGDEEADDEQQRRLEHRPAVPQRRQPAEDLHAGGDRDRHAGCGEKALAQPRQARRRTCGAPTGRRRGCRSRSAPSPAPDSRTPAAARKVATMVETMPTAGRKMM